jgi:hypothetical protein
MEYNDLLVLIRETISEAKKTQDKRLKAFTNSITKSIMALYSGRRSSLSSTQISVSELGVTPNTKSDEFYEIEAGVFPLAFDPSSIDPEIYEEGVDPFITVVLEIDKNASSFNVSASDKNITGIADLGIHIAVETPPGFPKSEMGILRNEIANSVRHELEHVTQGDVSDQPARAYAREDKYYTFLHGPHDVTSSYAKYLMKPAEIPAHVRGYTQNANNIKDLKQDISNLLDSYTQRGLISSTEKEVIFDTWIDWTKNHIHRKGF